MLINGWIRLDRKVTKWEWYDDKNTSRLFIHLLLTCNYKDKKWRGMLIEAGQRICGRKILAEETGLTEQEIRTALIRLKSTSNLTIETTNKFSIITICNYSDFQYKKEDEQPADQPASQPTTNHNVTNKQINKETILKGIQKPLESYPQVINKKTVNLKSTKEYQKKEILALSKMEKRLRGKGKL